MSKFKVGEIVILAYSRHTPSHVGSEGVIISLPQPCSYLAPNGKYSAAGEYTVEFNYGVTSCMESQLRKLRKRRPPEQPADQDFQEWFTKTIVNDPETVMKRVQANLQQFADLKPIEREERRGS